MPVLVLIAGVVLLSAAIAFSLVRIGRAQIGPGFPVGVVGVVGGALVTDISRMTLPGHSWVPLAGSAVGAVGWALVIISVHPNWRQVLCDALVVGPSLLLLGVCATVLVGDVPLNPQLDLDLLNLGATLYGSSLLTRIALNSPVASRLDRPLLATAGVLRVAAWAAIAATSAGLGTVPDSVIAVMMGLSYVLAPAVLVHMGLRSVQQVRLAPHPLTGRPAAMVTIVASCMALATIGMRHQEAGRPALLILSGVTAVTLVLMQMITLGELEAAGTAAARRETFYTALLGATADAIITCDIHGRITYASPVAPRVLGVDRDPTGRVLWELLDTPAVDVETAAGGGVLVEAHVGRRVLEAGVALHGDRLVVSVRDVTERDDLRWRLHRLAYEDPLTGLANRARLVQVVDDMIAAPDGRLRTAVLFVDLDRFKQINDASGHAVGDQVLVQVAHRLGELATDGFLARLGGDEFVIATTADHADVETLADRIIDVLGQPFEVDGGLYHIGASTGIAHATDEATADELLRRADLAMYRAKHNREGWARYEHAMAEAAVARVDTDNEVGAAIADDRVLMFLQPVIDTDTHAVVACEALARWVGRDGSVRSPAPLLEFAQRTGQLGTLTAWMLAQAVRRLSTAPTGHTMIAVNMPPTLLADPALVDGIMSLLDAHRVDPRRLELEITEEAMVEQGPRVLRVISALRADGIRMVVDDFGSGYSSMAYLSRFPIDGVKIDRTFTTQLTDSEASRSVVRGLMGIATEMGMTVVAEGVETTDQLAWLRELAVPRLQGFLFARPQDASSVADITRLDSWRQTSGEIGSRAA